MLTVEFKDKLDLLLIKYEDEIMEVMLDNSKNEYREAYTKFYKSKWHHYKQNIIDILDEMCITETNNDVLAMSLAITLATVLFDTSVIYEHINVEGLIDISFDIFKELEVED